MKQKNGCSPKSVFYADGDKGRITVATLPWKNNPRMIWVQDFEGNRLAELSPHNRDEARLQQRHLP